MAANLTILRKGLILIAVPLVFQTAFLALVAVIRRQGMDAAAWTLHTKDVIAQSALPRSRLLAAHDASRDFLLTADPAFAAKHERFARDARAELARLRWLVADNSGQVDRLDRIAVKVDRFLALLERTVEAVRSGRKDSAVAAIARREDDALLDEMRRDFAAFLDEERRLDAIRQARLERSWRRFDVLLYGGMLASVAGSLLLATMFGRGIGGRISALADNARRLAEGRELAPPIPGSDEVARLDADFRRMAATILESAAMLGRRAAELDAVNAELRERNQENEMFIYSVSHDLRSPLVNLQGFGKELGLIGQDLRALLSAGELGTDGRREALELVDVAMGESIHYIQTAVTRLGAIIDALLRLSRAGRVEYRRRPVDVAAAVGRIVASLRVTIEQRGAEVRVGRLPPAWGDATALEQAFANLIGNALNYLDPARPGVVEVGCVEPGETDGNGDGDGDDGHAGRVGPATYFVRDNGLGIPEAYRGKVFEAFQRLHGDVTAGEGVGLTLTRRAVQRHGGRIWFESAPGRGSTFYIALPGPPAAGPDEHEPARRAGRSRDGVSEGVR